MGLAGLALAMVSATPVAGDAADPVLAVEQLVWSGQHTRALALARRERAVMSRDAAVAADVRADLQRLVTYLELVERSPVPVRRDLRSADRLQDSIQTSYAIGQPEHMLAFARRQLALRESQLGEEHELVGDSHGAVGAALDELGRYDEALVSYQRALAIGVHARGADHPAVEAQLNNLAVLYDNMGRLAEAEQVYRQVLPMDLARIQADTLSYAATLNNLADNLVSQGKAREAVELTREVLDLRRRVLGPDALEVSQSLANLAIALRDAGELVAAIVAAHDAVNILNRAGRPQVLVAAAALQILGAAQYARQQYAEAESTFREALAIRIQVLGPAHPKTANTMANLANTLSRLHREDEADSLDVAALAIFHDTVGRYHPDVARCLTRRGARDLRRGRWADAESLLVEAAATFDVCRELVTPGDAQARFMMSPYPLLAEARLRLGDGAGAWWATERYQSRVLADALHFAGDRAGDSPAVRDHDQRRTLVAAQQRVLAIANDATAETPGGPELAEAREMLRTAERDWADACLHAARERPDRYGQAITPERVRRVLRPGEAIVGWLKCLSAGDSISSHAWVLRADRGPVWVALPASDPADETDAGAEFRSAIMRGRALETLQAGLWSSDFEALEVPLRGIRELVVIPSGDLLGVPIEALGAPGRRMVGERFVVHYAPSATLFAAAREAAVASGGVRRVRAPRALVFADPPFAPDEARATAASMDAAGAQHPTLFRRGAAKADSVAVSGYEATLREALFGERDALSRLPRLTGTRLEVASLERLAAPDSRFFFDADCSERCLNRVQEEQAGQRYDVVHFGTHAIVDPGRPERSMLVLSQRDSFPEGSEPPSEQDGVLTMSEVLARWRIKADLVVLSGCETARGERVAGEGLIGFPYAFMQRGTRSVIASLWKVDDQVTAVLMHRFYLNLYGDHRAAPSKARALADAKHALRATRGPDGGRPYADPFYWAAFILIGE